MFRTFDSDHPIGRLASQSDAYPSFSGSNVGWTFGLSPASQIATETRDNDAYAYPVANASKAYSVNGLNQYTAVAGTTQTYDANGNLTGDGTNAYVYDGENRLVSATAAGVTATLTYDPLGRLWQVVKGAANTRFLYDGDALGGEYDGSGTLTNRYVHGSNAAADDPLVWYVGAGTATKRFLHADHLGSIVPATNSAAAPTINAYDEYGVPAAANVGRFQYTGQAWLSELGLYYYKARMYSARDGRFLQTDPVGYEGGLNLYAYVGDDPANGSDPTGLDCPGGLAPGSSGSSDCPNPEHSASQRSTERVKIGENSTGTQAFIATQDRETGQILSVRSFETGKVNDESWIIDVAVAGIGGTLRAVVGERVVAGLGEIALSRSAAAEMARLQPARHAALQVLKQSRGATQALNSLFGSGIAGARQALASSSLSAPAGLDPAAGLLIERQCNGSWRGGWPLAIG